MTLNLSHTPKGKSMKIVKGCLIAIGAVGLVVILLGVAIAIFSPSNSSQTTTANVVSNAAITEQPQGVSPTDTPVVSQSSGPTYDSICNVKERNMTDPQMKAHADQSAGASFTNWNGWVYNVADAGNGQYNLEIAMTERGLFWARNIVIENIPNDLATSLNVEQKVNFDGRVAKVDYMFNVMCNPMTVDNFVLH